MYKWNYNEEITAEEFIKRLIPLVCDPVEAMEDGEGDLLLSEFFKLCEAARQLQYAKRQDAVKEDL